MTVCVFVHLTSLHRGWRQRGAAAFALSPHPPVYPPGEIAPLCPLALVLPLLRHSRIVSSHIVSLCLQVSLLTCELTPAARHSLSVSLTTGRSYPGIRVTRPPSPRASSLTRGNARASRRASRPLITSSTSCRRSHGSACWHIS